MSQSVGEKRQRTGEDGTENESEERSDAGNSPRSASPSSYREPFDSDHKIQRAGGKFHLLIGVTGSVASIKLTELLSEVYRQCPADKVFIKVVTTENASVFFNTAEIKETVYTDRDEWNMWRRRGDPVLHIELRKWADAFVIAPLDANTLAKIANGMCDNLLTCIVRAWDQKRPLYFAPAMNTYMWENPLTYQHLKTLKELLLYKEIPPIEKELMCGDKGYGAMASVQMIASIIASDVKNKFAVYSYSH
ncbi:flavoprotein [Aphelenchoides avenae]|nr:flavoprotein [Aphelenchus avenae]